MATMAKSLTVDKIISSHIKYRLTQFESNNFKTFQLTITRKAQDVIHEINDIYVPPESAPVCHSSYSTSYTTAGQPLRPHETQPPRTLLLTPGLL